MPNNNEMPNLENEPEKIADAPKGNETARMEDLTPEELAQYQEYMQANPKQKVPEQKKESGPDILEFEALVSPYESGQTVEELTAINTLEEALKSSLRKQVKEALILILKKLQAIEEETDISPDKFAELKQKYTRLSNAVGFINSGKVDHNR